MPTVRADRRRPAVVEHLEARRLLAATGTIAGRVYNDTFGDGVVGSDDTPVSGGFHVFLDANYNGVLDAGEMEKPVSGTGTFNFTNVPAGIYQLRQLPRDGWRQTVPAPLLYYKITVKSNTTRRGLLFADTTLPLIRGTVFMDANSNHKLDPGESGMPGWEVYLDQNNDGKYDNGEVLTTPNTDGTYQFDFQLTPGTTYTVRVVPQSGYRQTDPLSGSYTVTLGSGGTISHRDFGEKRLK